MVIRATEQQRPRQGAGPVRRLLASALVLLAVGWAAGAVLPGVRARLAALSPALPGDLPYTAEGAAVPAVDGVVLVAPRAGRFLPGVADGSRVAAGTAVAEVDDWRLPQLLARAAAASRAAGGREGAPGAQALLASRAAAAYRLAAAARTALAAPAAGTVRWLLPRRGPGVMLSLTAQASPGSGDLVQAGQPVGALVVAGRTGWIFRARGGAAAGLQPGVTANLLLPAAARVEVSAVAGRRAELVALDRGPASAGGPAVAATLAWGRAGGALVPAGAVLWRGGVAWVLAADRESGRLRWTRVRVLTRLGGTVAVADLAVGAWVAARPWLAGLWADRPPAAGV
jgi:hypothetical protein